MPFAVELYFDEESDAAVRKLWRALSDAGVPSLDGTPYRPHVSLSVCDEVSVPEFDGLLKDWVPSLPRVTLELSHLGRFPETQVVFLGVAPTKELVEAQEACHLLLNRISHSVWDHYKPGQWVPHCTLGMPIPDESVSVALEVSRAFELPIPATTVEVGLVEVPSGDILGSYSLKME